MTELITVRTTPELFIFGNPKAQQGQFTKPILGGASVVATQASGLIVPVAFKNVACSDSIANMEYSRRRLLRFGALSIVAVGFGMVVRNDAELVQMPFSSAGKSDARGTVYDQMAKRENPANKLGCPLGKGI